MTRSSPLTPEMTVTDTANLRFRLERGDGLCLNEHTINRDETDVVRFWITCGDEILDAATFLVDAGQEHIAHWQMETMQVHRYRVAERIVGELLDQLERGSKGHD